MIKVHDLLEHKDSEILVSIFNDTNEEVLVPIDTMYTSEGDVVLDVTPILLTINTNREMNLIKEYFTRVPEEFQNEQTKELLMTIFGLEYK